MPFRTVAFSRDGAELAASGDDKLVHAWSSETGAVSEIYSGQAGAVLAVAYTPDGKLISASADKSSGPPAAARTTGWPATRSGPTTRCSSRNTP